MTAPVRPALPGETCWHHGQQVRLRCVLMGGPKPHTAVLADGRRVEWDALRTWRHAVHEAMGAGW